MAHHHSHIGDGLTVLYSLVFLVLVLTGLKMLGATLKAWIGVLLLAALVIAGFVYALHH